MGELIYSFCLHQRVSFTPKNYERPDKAHLILLLQFARASALNGLPR